jgi:AraC-like DNA-binding protein
VSFVPVQLPELIGESFASQSTYREFHPPGLDDLAFCVWDIKVGDTGGPVINKILPDGCVDLVCDLTAGTADFAAFSKATEDFEMTGPAAQTGVRMRPGVFHGLYGLPASQVMDTTIPFADLEPHATLAPVFDPATPTPIKTQTLAAYLAAKGAGFTPSPLMRALPGIYDGTLTRVDDIASHLGYGVRQVSRRFLDEIGVSPRVFLNIVRLHRALRLLADDPTNTLAELAAEAGFFDQAHFVHQIKRYTGVSPLELLRRMTATGFLSPEA